MLPRVDDWSRERIAELQSLKHSYQLDLLQGLLPLSVATVVEQIRHESWDVRLSRVQVIRERWAKDGRESFDEHLFYRGPKGGESKQAFVDVTVILAVMSFCPGGVRAFGMHWENHDDL